MLIHLHIILISQIRLNRLINKILLLGYSKLIVAFGTSYLPNPIFPMKLYNSSFLLFVLLTSLVSICKFIDCYTFELIEFPSL